VGGDRFLSVYLSAPVEVCRQRDRTGAYRRADAGELAQFPGVSAVFEAPRHVDLELPTHRIPVVESVERILALLRERHVIE
jgi:adenylylsulfate kinase-like enzyme